MSLKLDENGLKPLGFPSSDLQAPPLDRLDSEVCCSPQHDLRSGRWRSPLEPSIVKNRHDQKVLFKEDGRGQKSSMSPLLQW
ncbi:hypothetical protein GQ457_11G023390 [Hibiscus cannabinus]